jgi:hypothetical protein
MIKGVYPMILILGAGQSLAESTSYQVEFELFEGDYLLSTPSVRVEIGQTGRIQIGSDTGLPLTLEFVLTERDKGLVLIESKADYHGETHHPDLLIEVGSEACLVIAEFALTVNVRKITANDA